MKKLNVKLPQGGSKRALHSGMYASALAVVVLAVTILVNLVIRALPTKYTEYDISTTSLFTLSDTTENLLHELNADVTAYYLAESGQEDANITRLLDRYAGESSHFSWQQRDPVLYPTFAQQYDGASAGSVVLVCGDNSDVLSYNDMYEMDLESYYTTGNLLAFIAFMVVVLIASILVGVICKRLTAGVTVFCVGAVVLFILFRLRPAWLLTAFNAVLSALALFDPFQDIVGGMFSIPAIAYYLSVIGLFLFLTGQALERRRWN